MRCNICDSVLSAPNYNEELGAYEPCDHCLSIIMEAAGSFIDRPAAAEDELGDDTPFEAKTSGPDPRARQVQLDLYKAMYDYP